MISGNNVELFTTVQKDKLLLGDKTYTATIKPMMNNINKGALLLGPESKKSEDVNAIVKAVKSAHNLYDGLPEDVRASVNTKSLKSGISAGLSVLQRTIKNQKETATLPRKRIEAVCATFAKKVEESQNLDDIMQCYDLARTVLPKKILAELTPVKEDAPQFTTDLLAELTLASQDNAHPDKKVAAEVIKNLLIDATRPVASTKASAKTLIS